MPLPSTGGTYPAVFGGSNPLTVRKGVVTDAFFRDYQQATTSLADPSAGLGTDGYFTPFAADGQVRTDLLIHNIDWTMKSTANLGFWHAGTLGAEGIGYDPNTDMEEVPTAQSLRPARVDITKEGETFEIVCLEQTPLIRYLVNEMPLIGIPDLGAANLTIAKPMEATIVERQFILFGFDGGHAFARTVPRAAKTKVAEFKWAREGKSGTGVRITFMILGDPYVNKPVLEHYDGAAWRATGGYATFPAPAPIATAVAGQKASVVFAQPSGRAAPFTLIVEKSINAGSTWTTAPFDTGSPTVAGSTVTAQVTGITTGSSNIFRVRATGTNLLQTNSLTSNTITGIA